MTRLPPVPPPPAGRQAVDSLFEDLAHTRALAKSKRVLWLLGLLWTTGTAAAGWAAGKLDTRSEVSKLSEHVAHLTGELIVLTSQQRDLVRTVQALSEPPAGLLYLHGQELRYVRRDYVQTTAAMYAGESQATRALKQRVAKEFGAKYDRQIAQGVAPAAAAEVVLGQIAVP